MADSAGTEVDSVTNAGEDNDSEISDNQLTVSDVDLDDISRKLISGKFLLSALELQTELLERGCELPRLRDFFSNPGNFESQARLDPVYPTRRTASNYTLDSIDDVSRYSDDNEREGDERVAVLEFELRKAKETIRELRENVTELASGNEHASRETTSDDIDLKTQEEAIKPFESRALNFLVNEYLLRHDYKVTSVTFADEVSNQDLDDWDDVGVNIPRPPVLLHLFRDHGKHIIDPVLKNEEEIKQLKEEIDRIEIVNLKLKRELATSKEENSNNTLECERLKATVLELQEKQQSNTDTPAGESEGQITQIPNHVTKDANYLPAGHENEEALSDNEGIISGESETVPEIVISSASDEGSTANLEMLGDVSVPDEGDSFTENFVPLEDEVETAGYHEEKDNDVSNEEEVQSPSNVDLYVAIEQEEPDQINVEEGQSLDDLQEQENIIGQEAHHEGPKRSSVSQSFLDTLLKLVHVKVDSRLAKEVQMATEAGETVIDVVARSLPNIVPNVLLNKRDELIPVILCAVRLHPNMKVRDDLLHMLFNLIKRPDEEQRKIIINGLVAFARTVGPTRIEAELLPQCWEQIAHKYSERRLLVAETCGFLAPFLPVELQSSLIFSMLRQMLQDDRNTKVRESAVKSLALNLAFTREAGKYTQAYELLVQTLGDKEEEVLSPAKQLLVPVLGVWAADLGKLETHLFTNLLEVLKTILQNAAAVTETDDKETAVQTIRDLQWQFKVYVECLVNLVSILFCFVLQEAPFSEEKIIPVTLNETRVPPMKNKLTTPSLIIGDEEKFNYLVHRFDNEMDIEEHNTWESLDWVCNNCISLICELTGYVSMSNGRFVGQLVCLTCVLCRIFGRPFTYRKIVPYFEKLMRSTVLFFLGETPPLCSALLPIFSCGVLSVFDGDDGFRRLFSFLKQSLVTLATEDLPLHSLLFCVQFLCANDKHQYGLVEMLRETLVYPSNKVRKATALLFEIVVRHVNGHLFSTQVAPAIITLSNDQDISVRVAAVPALGTVVEIRNDKNVLEKVFLQLQSLIDDPGLVGSVDLQKAIIKTFPRIIPNAEPRFREEFLVQRLRKMAEGNSYLADLSDQIEIAEFLIQSYSALLCCYLPRVVISSYVIPALRHLERDVKDLLPDSIDTVASLLVDATGKCRDDDRSSAGSGSSLGGGREVKSKLLSGLSKLKDASQKPKDIFKKKERDSSGSTTS